MNIPVILIMFGAVGFGLILAITVFSLLYVKKNNEETGLLKAKMDSLYQNLGVIQDIKGQFIKTEEIQRDIRARIDDARDNINRFKADHAARLEEEKIMRQAIKSMEGLLIGSRSRGQAGENIVAEALSVFPPTMVERNFRIKNNAVEFAVHLPNGKVLPIDSKFGRADLLGQLAEEEDPEVRTRIINEINKEIRGKIKEVIKYISPPITESHCMIALPDSAFSVCSNAYYDAYSKGIIIMSYSMTVPYLLTYLKLREQYTQSLDQENLIQALVLTRRILDDFEKMVESHMARGIKELQNSVDKARDFISELNTAVAKLDIKKNDRGE